MLLVSFFLLGWPQFGVNSHRNYEYICWELRIEELRHSPIGWNWKLTNRQFSVPQFSFLNSSTVQQFHEIGPSALYQSHRMRLYHFNRFCWAVRADTFSAVTEKVKHECVLWAAAGRQRGSILRGLGQMRGRGTGGRTCEPSSASLLPASNKGRR